jgi:hypothetical protein
VTCDKGYCADPGSTCCGDGVCQPGSECMTSKGGVITCCDPGAQACDDGNCCDAGTECATEPGHCQNIESSSLPSSTSSTSSPSSSSTPQISTPKQPKTTSSSSSSSCTFTSRQTSFTCTSAPTPAVKRYALATEAAQPGELDERQSSSGDDYLQYCNLCGQQIPVMIFPYTPGETEEMISSTCAGKAA